MIICIVHGYRLDGTGSNIYVRNIAQFLAMKGHNVVIMCQELEPEDIDFINEAYFFKSDNDKAELKFSRSTGYRGSCSVYVPDLNRRLLVYVYDKYKAFDYVNTFQEAGYDEIKDYIDRNVRALKKIIELRRPDILHAHHSIMQPYICYKAATPGGIPYITTVHGSALNFSVRVNKSLHEYAFAGLSCSELISPVSQYNADELIEYFNSKGQDLKKEIKIIPVGVDLEKFNTYAFKNENDRNTCIKELMDKLREKTITGVNGAGKGVKLSNKAFTQYLQGSLSTEDVHRYFLDEYESYEPLHIDSDIIDTFKKVDFLRREVILFVGKYLWTKGIQTILAALPLIFRKNPEAQVLIVGFGQSRGILQSMVYALAEGNEKLFKFFVDNHLQIDPGSRVNTPEICRAFLEELEDSGKIEEYFKAASKLDIIKKVHFTGRMSHEELRYLVPLCDVFVAPSIFTEAFGTVAIEALSCGVLPIITYDYGFREVHDTIYDELNIGNSIELKKLVLDKSFIPNLSHNISRVLDFQERRDFSFRKKCRNIAAHHYSWESITESYESTYGRLINRIKSKRQ
jgi:glycosyltransferase involved in cell wall biosynthesis